MYAIRSYYAMGPHPPALQEPLQVGGHRRSARVVGGVVYMNILVRKKSLRLSRDADVSAAPAVAQFQGQAL